MCDDDDFYDADTDVDTEDSYHWEDPIPQKVRYYPASPPTPLGQRFAYFKYDKRFKEFSRKLSLTFIPRQKNGRPLKRMLCVYLDGNSFVLDVQGMGQAREEFPPMELFEHYVSMATVPVYVMQANIYTSNDKYANLKWRQLQEAIHKNKAYIKIHGERFMLCRLDFDGFEITAAFEYRPDAYYGGHDKLRHAEHTHQDRFRKFAILERKIKTNE